MPWVAKNWKLSALCPQIKKNGKKSVWGRFEPESRFAKSKMPKFGIFATHGIFWLPLSYEHYPVDKWVKSAIQRKKGLQIR